MNKGISKTIIFDKNISEIDYDKNIKDDEVLILAEQTNE
jgi:hypothetical protein